ncbi:acyl carrier protein [Saccharothrix sp. NRRL B-16314]|uniref:acyl carrier protein n=1 Tax=Saccharothrix sp. NRRL B-16314 TaxID=1463825 RepID=UPI000526AF7D|nr:acyl carrier protein [Saccharothrix sp. NRRL B-16314]
MSDTVKNRILAFIKGRYPDVEFDTSQDIFQLGFVNSLFAMELVMFVEKNFGITIPNNELQLDNFRTVDSMDALVTRCSTVEVARV